MENTLFNYIDILKAQLEIRSSKNASYSLRAFARDLELAPSRLSEILNKKKGLSEKAAKDLANKIGLNEKEKEYFILSAKALHSRSTKEKTEASKELKEKLSPESVSRQLELVEFEQAHNWYHMAILELIELDECEHTVEWFAKKLRLKKAIVKNALERLEKIRWIVCDKGIYRATFESSTTSYDIPSDAIKKYHEEILKKAEQSLYLDEVHQREFLNMTLAFSKDQMKEAKEAIRLFQKEFANKFYSQETQKDSVYQLSVQLFRLDANINQSELLTKEV